MNKKNDKIKIKANFEDVIKLAVKNRKTKKKKTLKERVPKKKED